MSVPLSFRQAAALVARREIVQRLRDKSFLISTVITILILTVVLLAPKLFGGDDTSEVAFAGPRADALATAAEAGAEQLRMPLEQQAYPGAAAAKQALSEDELDAYVTATAIIVRSELDPQLEGVLQTAHTQVAGAERLRAEGIDPVRVAAATADVPKLSVDAIDPADPKAELRGQIAFVGSIILYGQLIGYCMWVAFGVVEEKASRVVEIILSAVSSKALLAGKILGIGLLGFLQLALISVVGIGIGSATGMLTVDPDLLVPVGFVLLWFVLGYAFYSAVFAATASRVSRQEELQNVVGPLNMAIMASFFATFYVNANPDALFSRILAVVPPFSALCSPVRMARGEAPWWETGLAVGLMLIAIVFLVRAGGRIYEGAVLRMGAKISLKDAWASSRAASTASAGS